MKNVKKLLSIVMVLTLVLSLGASALAVDITVKEKDGESTGSYSAYQLFTLTTTADATEDSKGYSYSVNEQYRGIMYLAAAVNSDEALIDYLEELADDPDGLRTFADTVYGAIKQSGWEADYTAENGTFADVPQGYYLIAEEGAAGGATSQVMLDTAGRQNVDVTTKEDVPSSQKKVQEHNDTTDTNSAWQDGADYDIGDQVPFQLTATIPADTTAAYYGAYELVFHDKESAGLTFNKDSVVVTVNGTKLTAGYTVVTEDLEDGCAFEIVFDDVKTLDGFTADDGVDDVIVVEYTSELNEHAVIGSAGNPNEMHIEYSNNPYGEGTGKTPDDKVIVFTFELDVNKVDEEEQDLEGAGFTLLKKLDKAPDGITPVETTYEGLRILKAGSVVKYGDSIYVVEHEQITGVTKFEFKGLDTAEYLLVETTVPDGYNRADDIVITVAATYDTNSADPKLTGLTVTPADIGFTAVQTSGIISGAVQNQTGVELPETGGIGTTIFYIVGAVLVAGAVILLVTRKRMSGAEK